MADAKRSADWDWASEICNLLFNAHRNPKESSPTRPVDWHPLKRQSQDPGSDVIPTDITALKVFIPPTEERRIG